MDNSGINLVVRFTSSFPDLSLHFEEGTASVHDVKERISQVHPDTRNRRLKLIYAGRLLSDNELLDQVIRTDFCFIHCLVGDVIDVGRREQDLPVERTAALVGFDRLQSAGLSGDDISELRTYFQQVNGQGSVEDEDRWIDDTSISEGNYKEMLVGLCVGFFAGLLALVFVWEASLLTKRQRMAVMAGFLVNLSFGVLRVYY